MKSIECQIECIRFVSSDEKRQGGARRDNEVLLQRQKGDSTVPYRVIDTVNKLSAEEWERVVAVFVQGPAWQFKDWPVAGGNPTEIFNHSICSLPTRLTRATLHTCAR